MGNFFYWIFEGWRADWLTPMLGVSSAYNRRCTGYDDAGRAATARNLRAIACRTERNAWASLSWMCCSGRSEASGLVSRGTSQQGYHCGREATAPPASSPHRWGNPQKSRCI